MIYSCDACVHCVSHWETVQHLYRKLWSSEERQEAGDAFPLPIAFEEQPEGAQKINFFALSCRPRHEDCSAYAERNPLTNAFLAGSFMNRVRLRANKCILNKAFGNIKSRIWQ